MAALSSGTTAGDIVRRALEDVGVVGVGQLPLPEDMNYGLSRFNAMIGQFNRRRWLVFHTVDIACQTTGLNVYSVGIGQNFNVPRPDKIEDGCYFRQYFGGATSSPNSNTPFAPGDFNNDFGSDFSTLGSLVSQPNGYAVDYPLTVLNSREDWNRIALKDMASWPSFVFYDPTYTLGAPIGNGPPTASSSPTGYLYVNPVPAAGQFELHILVKDVLTTYPTPATVLVVPPEYEEAFEYNLALRFAAKYQIDASKEVIGLARASLATIRSANVQVPLARLPGDLFSARAGSRYNVYSDRSF